MSYPVIKICLLIIICSLANACSTSSKSAWHRKEIFQAHTWRRLSNKVLRIFSRKSAQR